MSAIQTKWDAERAAILAAQAEETMKAVQKERALQALIEKQRKEHKYESDRLSILYQSALSRLSDRPDRPDSGGVPKGSDTGTEPATGCTGAELYRQDAEVALGIARDADQLRLALKACVAHTTEIERQLNGE
jgi:acetyl-CoA carboxylase alpha subunit